MTTYLSYGYPINVLTTTSAGAVTGTTYALPASSQNEITWQVVADGSAQSTNMEISNDGSAWTSADTNVVATGSSKNYGPTSAKFVRVNQVSRTGGTSTTINITVTKATSASAGSGSTLTNFSALKFLAGDGTAAAPSFSFTNDSDTGFYSVAANNMDFSSNGIARMRLGTAGIALLRDDFSTITMGSSPDTTLARTAAGKIQLTGTTPMLQLGGTTSSFPALKPSGALVQVRLADDSGFAQLSASTVNITGALSGTNPIIFVAAPTISSGFAASGTTLTPNNGTAAFVITVGATTPGSSGVIGLPAATNGWNCYVTDITGAAAHAGLHTVQMSSTTTSVTVESQNAAGVATAWAGNSILRCSAFAY